MLKNKYRYVSAHDVCVCGMRVYVCVCVCLYVCISCVRAYYDVK